MALFGLLVAVVSVLGQARRGRLPTHFSTTGRAYEPDVTTAVALAVVDLQDQVDAVQAALDQLAAVERNGDAQD